MRYFANRWSWLQFANIKIERILHKLLVLSWRSISATTTPNLSLIFIKKQQQHIDVFLRSSFIRFPSKVTCRSLSKGYFQVLIWFLWWFMRCFDKRHTQTRSKSLSPTFTFQPWAMKKWKQPQDKRSEMFTDCQRNWATKTGLTNPQVLQGT